MRVKAGKKTESVKAMLVLHHDDPPCEAKLVDGYCNECGFRPDMQSTCFHYHCPICDVSLKEMRCPQCKETFKKE